MSALQQETYNKIIAFYDVAERLLQTVDNPIQQHPEAQFNRVEPMVLKIEKSTDLLADAYRNFVRSGKKPGMFTRKRIEKTLQDLYIVVSQAEQAEYL